MTLSTAPSVRSVRRAADLRLAWQAARAQQPMARAYDVAADLGVSELELVAAALGTPECVRLRNDDMPALLGAMGGLGRVMALTRNADAVIEKHGVWAPFSRRGDVGLVLDHGIDLRLFLSRWCHVLALRSETARGTRRSVQFFDADGSAIHKVFVLEGGDPSAAAAYDALVARFLADDQLSPPDVIALEPEAPPKPDGEVDVEGFRAAWLALEDTHDFFPLLRRFGLARRQALTLAPVGHARRVFADCLRGLLQAAAEEQLPIMVFVGNAGCIEIHSGPIERVKPLGVWLNILDAEFNLHLREDRVAEAWVVRKPTLDGVVTSLELFDAKGNVIAMLFGARKPGRPEDPEWRALVESL